MTESGESPRAAHGSRRGAGVAPRGGVGVLDSPETPGGCWMLYSMIDMPRPVSVDVGQEGWVSYEEGPQDGFDWRAIRVRPDGTPPGPVIEPSPRSSAYRSWLTLSFDAKPQADS